MASNDSSALSSIHLPPIQEGEHEESPQKGRRLEGELESQDGANADGGDNGATAVAQTPIRDTTGDPGSENEFATPQEYAEATSARREVVNRRSTGEEEPSSPVAKNLVNAF